MGWIVRVALLAGGALAALFMSREAESFMVAQGMLALGAVAGVLLMVALFRRRGRPGKDDASQRRR